MRTPFKLKSKRRWQLAIYIFACLAIVGISSSTIVSASHLSEQINQLQQDNQQSSSSQKVLENEAANLSAKIATLQDEISGLESQINNNKLRSNEVQNRLTQTEAELERQKMILRASVKTLYMTSGASTIELLASSDSFSDYFDKQVYLSSVQEKIKLSMDKIITLKAELKSQKDILDKLIADQQHMQIQLDSQRSENNRLLSMNQDQRASVENEIQQNNLKIADLRRQQAAENARVFSGGIPQGIPGGGGYPGKWAFAPMDSLIDSWGMYNRECVSYTAWKVASTGRFMPYWGGRGNAKDWDDNARAGNIAVDGNARAGDVAISHAGIYGHTMYVEEVYGDGSIRVSDYNQQWDGVYRIYNISASKASTYTYIHF